MEVNESILILSSNFSILHIAIDEKFIDSANKTFNEAFPDQNTFYIIHPARDKPLKHLKRSGYRIFENRSGLLEILIEEVKKHDLIVLHGLNLFTGQLAGKINLSNVLWLFWGAEVYENSILYKDELLGTKTKHVKSSLEKKSLAEMPKALYRRIKYGQNRPANLHKITAKVIKNINHFGALHKEEIELFKKENILKESCTLIPFTYYPIEDFRLDPISKDGEGNILLGNSASYTNNHLEAIDILSQLKLGNRNVITPLSYGNKKYAEFVSNYGSKVLGENFHPLTDFLPLIEYNRIVRSCTFVIMNHYRQQGVGNILTAVWNGSKVFLNESNTIYHYLKRLGVFVFPINNDLGKDLIPLSNEQIQTNRSILKMELQEKVVVQRLKESILSIIPK